jgi:hypothetical protein
LTFRRPSIIFKPWKIGSMWSKPGVMTASGQFFFVYTCWFLNPCLKGVLQVFPLQVIKYHVYFLSIFYGSLYFQKLINNSWGKHKEKSLACRIFICDRDFSVILYYKWEIGNQFDHLITNFPFVMQNDWKTVNFSRLYYPHFTTFRNETLEYY